LKLLKNQFVNTIGTSVGLLGINFVTGVLIARLLKSEGRGELAAITTWATILGWASAFGFSEAITYLQSKRPQDGPRIFGTSITAAFALGSLGVLAAEILVPYAFAAQSAETIALSRLFMMVIYMNVASGFLTALVSGNQDFKFLNFVRIAQPALYAVCLLCLWLFQLLSVPAVLLVSAAIGLGFTFLTASRLFSTIGIGRPSAAIFREGLSYGLKLQGALFGALGNSRLDIMLMPAFLASAEIGLYSVATNLSALVTSVLGSLSLIVFPAATRAGRTGGLTLVAKSLRLVLVCGGLFALALFWSAPFLIRSVYGASFAGAVLPLRILLPGVVLMAATGIINCGLQAVNRPTMASYAQICGLVVTLIGLKMTLKPLGIVGASLTSTASYTVCFLVALLLLGKEQDFMISQVVSFRAFVADGMLIMTKVQRLSLRGLSLRTENR